MNNANINLLIKDTAPKPANSKGLVLFRYVALGSFGLSLLASVVFLLLVVFHPLPKYQEDKNTLIQQISNSSEKYTNLLSLSDRLKNINSVLAKRPKYEELMELLKTQIPAGGNVQAIKMVNSNITFGVSSNSLEHIETFISNIKRVNEGEKRVFRTLTLTTLTYNSQLGQYVLTLDMTLI